MQPRTELGLELGSTAPYGLRKLAWPSKSSPLGPNPLFYRLTYPIVTAGTGPRAHNTFRAHMVLISFKIRSKMHTISLDYIFIPNAVVKHKHVFYEDKRASAPRKSYCGPHLLASTSTAPPL